jgi:predicted outer membrane repeat protein
LLGALLTVLLTALPARSSPLLAIGGTRYVATTGTDSGACTSSMSPCLTIAHAVSQAVSGDTISIAAGTYPEQVIVGTKVLTFVGAGAGSTFVDGSNTGRVFSITAPSATFANLTIQNGHVISDSGGGIYASGTLTLTNVDVLSNTVVGNASSNYVGGGVRVRSELRVTGGRFEHNLVTGGGEGGAISSSAPAAPHPNVTISGTTFVSNTAKFGGGISLAGSVWLTNTQFISNSATSRGGGVYQNATGTLTLSGGRFERNTAGSSGTTPGGGGLYFS